MPSDKTRTSDDTRLSYKGPVMQQGRVILDRDFNSLRETLSEAIAADALAMVGPAGTPDNGFNISLPVASPPSSFWAPPSPLTAPAQTAFDDFLISPGTMYVGGQRAVFTAGDLLSTTYTYSYFDQPDWVNPFDPANGSPPSLPSDQEFVYLHLSEQEVSSVEDPDLKDVALGGPDTTQRVRLMRRVKRQPVSGDLCDAALAQARTAWSQEGLYFDPDTMRLQPLATAQVSFTQSLTTADPCDPVAQGGYLGADNQLIRVQLGKSGEIPQLLWGYDNASFIYRVQASADGLTLTLQQSPVDAFHSPKAGQVVEILFTGAVLESDLDESNPLVNPQIVRCVAEAYGQTQTLAQDYDPVAGTLTLSEAITLPPAALAGLPLFARIWQAALPLDTTGAAIELTSSVSGTTATTGLQITIGLSSSGIPVGAYWLIAVRPSTPQAVYPERFLMSPQLPDGPRQWVCPLAVIDWLAKNSSPPGEPVTDCRLHFDNLVTRTEVEDLISSVNCYDSAGQLLTLNDGDTIDGSELAQGLEVLLREDINPATATVGSCFVTLELPFTGPTAQTVGFQPTVVAAGVAADATTIAWTPAPNAKDYLTSHLPDPADGSFAADWTLDPPGADWEYTPGGAVANITAENPPIGAGYVAINTQKVPSSATGLRMTVVPQSLTTQTTVSLIFNYTSPLDYWALTYTSGVVSDPGEGDYSVQTSLGLNHFVNNQAEIAAPSQYQTLFYPFTSLTLSIDVSGSLLAFTAVATTRDPNSGLTTTANYSVAPPTTMQVIVPVTTTTPVFENQNPILVDQVAAKQRVAPVAKVPIRTTGPVARIGGTSAADINLERVADLSAVAPVASQVVASQVVTTKTTTTETTVTEPIAVAPALQQFLPGLQVGMATSYSGVGTAVATTAFSLLQINYPSSSQVLLPSAAVGRLLCRLTVKRDLLMPADVQGNVASSSRPDFSRWFWVTPTMGGDSYYGSSSGSGSGGVGIGGGGIEGQGGEGFDS